MVMPGAYHFRQLFLIAIPCALESPSSVWSNLVEYWFKAVSEAFSGSIKLLITLSYTPFTCPGINIKVSITSWATQWRRNPLELYSNTVRVIRGGGHIESNYAVDKKVMKGSHAIADHLNKRCLESPRILSPSRTLDVRAAATSRS